MRFLIFIFLLSPFYSTIAQDLSQKYLDTLEDEALLTLFNEVSEDSIEAEQVARTYLKRARLEGDTIKMARGYDRLARIFHPEKNLRFADSVIALTENNPQITYPALGYILKGYILHNQSNLKLAVSYYLKAHEIALEQGNILQQVNISNFLIFYKVVWGNSTEALEMQYRRHNIIMSDEYSDAISTSTRKGADINLEMIQLREEISSYQNFAFCHYKMKSLDSAKYYVRKIDEIITKYNWVEEEEFKKFNMEISMEIDYYDNNYEKVIVWSDSIISHWKGKLKSDELMNAHLFKGMAYMKLNATEVGIEHLKIADSIYEKYSLNIVQPQERMLFEQLLEHAKTYRDTAGTIEYLNKLILIDSIIKTNIQFFDEELERKLETPELLREKEEVILNLEEENEKARRKFFIIFSMLACSVAFAIYYLRKVYLYKQRFAKLIKTPSIKNQLVKKENSRKSGNYKLEENVATEIVDDILEKLNHFEENLYFLDKQLTLRKLSKKFKTNDHYLSRIINLKLQKNFSQYLHDLRLEYAVKTVITNRQYRKYTIKAIANECGYNSSESFSRAFYKKYGIYPSYYIKRLDKKDYQ